ncbi:MAG TPA: hypothetical protein VFP39_06320, partial [Gemmatimonadales bacterium]|nr:hypothetical protein [Gemmatimonadales bacterium]
PTDPRVGGRTASLGQPIRWHWQIGFGTGFYLAGPSNNLMVRAAGGTYYAPLNPITKLAEIGMETYVGARGSKVDGGVRGVFQVPYLSAGLGGDYNLRDGRLDMLVTAHTPVRRGGLLTHGTMLRLDWYPLRSHSFTLGVSVPLGDPLAGRNRPLQDYVDVARPLHTPSSHHASAPALHAAIDSLRVSAEWIRRFVAPFLDQDGRNEGIALARTTRYVTDLREHLATRNLESEVRFFHAELEHAFAIAAANDTAGRQLEEQSRAILLDEVLLPYDGLLGRKKHNDTLRGLSLAARGQFGRWVTRSMSLSAVQTEDVLYVFEAVTEMLEGVRHKAAQEWDDPRLAWLPLQYALLPEQYDEQGELDSLVARATHVSFTDHNRLTYVANLQFLSELLQMIRETRSYHVLWIHDFPALDSAQAIDWASFTVLKGYLSALAARVEAYDSTGALPSYFIFLDQHYYEQRKSRILMTVLEDPLRASPQLAHGSARDSAQLDSALTRLRTAVANSRVLQAERREYGDAWLRNRIKVHVNITNRVDASFWSGGVISSVFGYPDDVMRDHRKISFRDVSEDNPFDGLAIFTGMGVGQQYLGPGWDDRSLKLGGPALLQIRQAARELLITQGITESDLPLPLRRGLPADAAVLQAQLAALPDAARYDGRAAVLVNGTGYLPKPLNVAKAVLYSLLPAGSVIKVPDSLWNSEFYGGLLVGACLRGATVLIIAPAQDNAPSNGFPQMVRARELMTRLLIVRRELRAAIAEAGGDLRTGLYALPVDRHGFASRAERWAQQVDTSPMLRALLPFAHGLVPMVASVGRGNDNSAGSPVAPTATGRPPKLHQKVQFLATGPFWRAITASPEWPEFMAAYLRYRAATYSPQGTDGVAQGLADSLEEMAGRLLAPVRDTPRAASFAILGSQNQDPRGMFMDGEVGVLFTGSQSLVPLVDLVFMVGTVTWVNDQATLDRLIPPPGELKRRIARNTKDGV